MNDCCFGMQDLQQCSGGWQVMAALLLLRAARAEQWPPPLGIPLLLLHTKGFLLPHAGLAMMQRWLASPGCASTAARRSWPATATGTWHDFAIAASHERSVAAACRTRNNAVVVGEPWLRFYCSAPLVASNGHRIGTL